MRFADLFAGHSQLIVKHNMLNPNKDVCVGCSFEVDAIEGARVHLFCNYGVAPIPVQDLSGFSVFSRDECLDMTPKGRNETVRGNLTDWVRPHDRYGATGANPFGLFVAEGSCCHDS